MKFVQKFFVTIGLFLIANHKTIQSLQNYCNISQLPYIRIPWRDSNPGGSSILQADAMTTAPRRQVAYFG
jgi:hypothetical protein